MEKNPIGEKENKKKLSSFLPKDLIEEINKNVKDKKNLSNNKPSFSLKEKDVYQKTNQNMASTIIENHNNHINHTNHTNHINHINISNNNHNYNFNIKNGSYKNQNLPQFQFNGNGINSTDLDLDDEGFFNGNNTFNINSKNNLLNINNGKSMLYGNVDINDLKQYINDLNNLNSMNVINGLNGLNGINGINGNNHNNDVYKKIMITTLIT